MRRIVFGLLMAAVVFWAWSSWSGDDAVAESRPRADLAAMLASTAVEPPVSANDEPAADPAMERAFTLLVQGLRDGDPAARQQAIRLLGRDDLLSSHRAQLSELLGQAAAGDPAVPAGGTGEPAAPAGDRFDAAGLDDVDAILERLGPNNEFLHTSKGRALARRALALLPDLDDPKAVAVGTALLERCMRGPIARSDRDAIALVDAAYAAHRVRADRVLCDPANLTRARSCTVAKGDSLAGIAQRFRKEGIAIEAGTLAVLNRIHNPNAIRIGQRIRCPLDPVQAILEKRSFLMAVYLGERILRLYWVGHGADGKTPVAEFIVSEKTKDPDWYSPDGPVYPAGSPENILGHYFIKFENPSYSGFGAHGTPRPETIGTMSSMGCIRMYDDDIDELFRLLPRKAKVIIRDSH